jgi:hypothetical protein
MWRSGIRHAVAVFLTSILLSPAEWAAADIVLARYGKIANAAPGPLRFYLSLTGTGLLTSSCARQKTMLNNGSPIMRIDFVRSGGFGFPLRKAIRGTITLNNGNGAYISSDVTYKRTLSTDEVQQLRAGADPSELDKAATQIARNRSRGAADLDHYQITITTQDGRHHDVDFNTSLSSNELRGVSPPVIKLLRWIQEEAKKITAHGSSAK